MHDMNMTTNEVAEKRRYRQKIPWPGLFGWYNRYVHNQK